jgi:hypothetical protein
MFTSPARVISDYAIRLLQDAPSLRPSKGILKRFINSCRHIRPLRRAAVWSPHEDRPKLDDMLRVCDFFECRQNRRCKQYSYDDKMDENLKQSQTLSEVEGSHRAERGTGSTRPPFETLSAEDVYARLVFAKLGNERLDSDAITRRISPTSRSMSEPVVNGPFAHLQFFAINVKIKRTYKLVTSN